MITSPLILLISCADITLKPNQPTVSIEELTAAALSYARISAVQQERLAAILAAMRAGAFEVHGDKIRIRNR